VLRARGLQVGPYAVISDREWTTDADGALKRLGSLGLPVFVKPARGGSSIGITKVTAPADLVAAIEAARVSDPKIIVESAVRGREIECAVLDGLGGQPARASVPSEIHVADEYEFYDFEAKYLTDATHFDIPAQLDDATTDEVRRLAVDAFHALGCSGLARVDFFLTDEGIVVNEVNTMPGFTPTSMYPRMWEASGVPYAELVDHLVQVARERGTGLR
jgi:D-alanine-D-alanine ligase